MDWTKTHGRLLAGAFEQVLGRAESGAVAFTRCLDTEVVEFLARSDAFSLKDWDPFRVADSRDDTKRTITADIAVEWREEKRPATLLLVDVDRAGAGMDGIYSAAREVDEAGLFDVAQRLALREVSEQRNSACRRFAERAIRTARRAVGRDSVSPWIAFDFLVQVAECEDHVGGHLHRLGLWPVTNTNGLDTGDLETSRKLVDRLLGVGGRGLTVPARIDSLQLEGLDASGSARLERFLHEADALPIREAVRRLADEPDLWVGVIGVRTERIRTIGMTPWRLTTGRVAKWSGLTEGKDDDLPSLVMKPNPTSSSAYSTLEIRWKPSPAGITKGTVDYRIAVLTSMEELAARELAHTARKGGEKCRFNNEDFESLPEDALISAKVVVSVPGDEQVEPEESEEFLIRFGEPEDKTAGGAGKKVRAFSEGLAELANREEISAVVSNPVGFSFDDKKNVALLRTKGKKRLSFQVPRPPLIREVENQWIAADGQPGRWRIRVRESGDVADEVDFITETGEGAAWTRVETASRRLAADLSKSGGLVGHVHDDDLSSFDVTKNYILAWAACLEQGEPDLALCNTVEVRSLAGRLIGLIVLPMHPLRLAWHAAYDNLVLHAACEQGQKAGAIQKEFSCLDGAMFPAFLPNLDGGAFVFADTLGFHVVGMVPDTDREPKAAVAILANALGGTGATDNAPTVGGQSAKLVGDEIGKYLDCHDASRMLHVHALRAGDGMTIARALGHVHEELPSEIQGGEQEVDSDETESALAFSLEMYPSHEQRGIAGRYISAARERRRTGAGGVAADDRWMLESLSLPGGVTMPRLRWAKKEIQEPRTSAHIAVAFDTFESKVLLDQGSGTGKAPFRAFGLLSFYEREFSAKPTPVWRSTVPATTDGEKHPSERGHSERLERVQRAIRQAVATHVQRLDAAGESATDQICSDKSSAPLPVLHTAVPLDKEKSLERLHGLCDWVVTLDRNAGIEYFDSPLDNPTIYDAYVIDCVPEREDLGCLQLITSTSNLDEVRSLLDSALDRMGLSRSRRNAEFLLQHLKALSGRLAIRLTGNKPPTSELAALAVAHAHCRQAPDTDECWLSLESGFILPADDVRDLVPPLVEGGDERQVRADLIYVTTVPRKGLRFRFVEVKYRRDLRAARSPDLLQRIADQTGGTRKRWAQWYGHEECSAFRAIRRAKLSRVLRFYADKARRHYLSAGRHAELVAEIDRMVERGGSYALEMDDWTDDLGWIFCPEYAGRKPMRVPPMDWLGPAVFLFGPGILPDSDSKGEGGALPPSEGLIKPDQTSSSTSSSDHPVDKGGNQSVAANKSSPPASADSNPAILLGTDAIANTEVRWPLSIAGNPHLLLAGLPGMGKTTCLLNLCRQMIEADVKPIVFSYHEDIDEKLQRLVDQVRFVDFNGLGFNPLHVVDRETPMAYLDVAGAMRDIFSAIYPDLGDIQSDRIRKAIRDSFKEVGWENAPPSADLQEPAFVRFLEILRSDPKPNQSLRSLLARLDELDDYGFFTTDESQGSLWEGDQPTVVRVHTTQNDNLQRAFASLVFYGLYKDMFRRGLQDRITHALVFDEAHRAARLKLIPTMAKECRKYGISLVLASQEAGDFHDSVFSAIANYLVLRLNESDAKALVRNVADSRQERGLVDRLKQMDRFKALFFREGSRRPSSVKLSAEPTSS